MAGAQLDIKIIAHDMASNVVSKVGGVFDGLGRAGLAIGGLKAIAEGIGGIATSMIEGNAKMETYETQLGTLLGSTDAAKERIAQLSKIGAETPFELNQLVAAEKIMAGFGLTTQKTQQLAGLSLDEYRTRMGDMAAATGTDLSEVTLLWSKFGSGATGEAISRLQELGIVTREQMAEMGIQFSKSGELLSPVPEAMRVALEIANQKMGGGMAALSQTFEGQMSTLSDNFNQAKVLLMQPIFEVLKIGLTSVNELLSSEAFQTGLTTFATTSANAIRGTIAVVQELFAVFQGGAGEGATDLLSKIFPPDIAAGIVEAVRQIGDAWRTVIQVFTDGWEPSAEIEPLSNALGGVALVIRNVLIPAVMAVGAFMLEQFGVVVDWVVANWPLIQQTIATVLGAIGALWSEHSDTITAVVKALWEIVKTVIGTGLATILDTIKLGMQLINGDFDGAWETFKGIIERQLAAAGTILGAAFDALYAIVDAATGGMLTSISTWMTDTSNAISGGMDTITTAISTGWENAKTTVSNILPTIKTVVMAMWNALPEDIRTDLALIASHITTQGQTWVTNLTTAGSSMLTAITTKLAEMVTAATTWATSTFLAPITGLAASTGTAMTTAGSGMLTAISGKLGEIVGRISGWVEEFLAPVRNMATTAQSAASAVGKAIVDGITAAINAGVQAIRDAATRAARAALDAAKSALGISSPSRLFNVEVGQQIVAGLMAGVEEMRRPLNAQIGGLVQVPTLAPAYAGPGSGVAAASGRQTHEHIVRVGDMEAMRIVVVGRELASTVYGSNNVG